MLHFPGPLWLEIIHGIIATVTCCVLVDFSNYKKSNIKMNILNDCILGGIGGIFIGLFYYLINLI
jgi:hypothetical protein